MATGTHAHHNCVNTPTEPNAPMRLPAGSHGPCQLAASHAHSFLLGTTRQQLAAQETRQRRCHVRVTPFDGICKSNSKIHNYSSDKRQAVTIIITPQSFVPSRPLRRLLAAACTRVPAECARSGAWWGASIVCAAVQPQQLAAGGGHAMWVQHRLRCVALCCRGRRARPMSA